MPKTGLCYGVCIMQSLPQPSFSPPLSLSLLTFDFIRPPQERVSIYKQHHKFIIGKGGANIRKIRDETNTRIDLPDESSESSEIVITGRKEDVLLARDRIQKIQNELDNIVQKDINVPSKFHNSIIGPGGRLIQSIMEECGGVQIKFPAADSKSDKVGWAAGGRDGERGLMSTADAR